VKPPRFDYTAPTALPEALRALGEGACPLAGGQSLVLEMHYRRQRPSALVDLNGIAELDHITAGDDGLRVGALARHRAFEQPVAGPLGRLLSRAAVHIAHPPVRNRGTMLGSLAWANPASEWPAVALALQAELTLASASATRTVPAEEFFRGPHTTARRPDELLVEARFPALEGAAGFVEHRRTHASFAQVAAAVALTVRGGAVRQARIALAGAADRPIRVRAAEQHLVGLEVGRVAGGGSDEDAFRRAGELAAAAADPIPEPHGSAEHKRQVAAVLVRRALQQAHQDQADQDQPHQDGACGT